MFGCLAGWLVVWLADSLVGWLAGFIAWPGAGFDPSLLDAITDAKDYHGPHQEVVALFTSLREIAGSLNIISSPGAGVQTTMTFARA